MVRAFIATLALAATSQQASSDTSYEKLVDWIRDGSGFVTDQQEMRVEDDTGVRGLFAKVSIGEGTLLARIPWSHLIANADMCSTIALVRGATPRSEIRINPMLQTN